MNTLAIVFCIASGLLFLAAAHPKLVRAWMIPLGLACFASGFLTALWLGWPHHII
jgi:hypothetical protein